VGYQKTGMKNINNITPKFSFFYEPITNIQKHKDIDLADAFKVISGKYLKNQTLKLRSIKEKDENRKYKTTNFPYVTFSGIFDRRNEKALIQHSGLIAIDFDHLGNVEKTKQLLLKDQYFETKLLFISPNGTGLKWIIQIDLSKGHTHKTMFEAIYHYINQTYFIEIDKACKDVSRATFLCFDPTAFIHPKYLINEFKI